MLTPVDLVDSLTDWAWQPKTDGQAGHEPAFYREVCRDPVPQRPIR